MAEMKLCKDCRFYAPDADQRYDKCLSPSIPEPQVSPVRGNLIQSEVVYCDLLRRHDGPKYCGPNAKWFEPRGEGQ